LVHSIFGEAPAAIYGGEKYFRVKWNFFLFVCHDRCALGDQSRLVPASAAVPAAAKQQNDDQNDEKRGGIHV
jgi:hypothetical protein